MKGPGEGDKEVKIDDALTQITYMRQLTDATRLRAAGGYPSFILWGTAWMIGYLVAIWVPWIWAAVLPAATLGNFLIGRLLRRGGQQPFHPLWNKLGWMNLILFATAVAASVLIAHSARGAATFWPAAVGIIYMVNGVFIGREMVLIGGWLIIAALISLTMPFTSALIWLAIGGAGSLLLTGLLLRRQFRAERPRPTEPSAETP